MGLKIPSNHYVSHLHEMNSPEYMNRCCMIYSRVYEGFQRCLINDQNKEEANNKYENDLFVFQFDKYQNMLCCMMT